MCLKKQKFILTIFIEKQLGITKIALQPRVHNSLHIFDHVGETKNFVGSWVMRTCCSSPVGNMS